MAEKKTRTSSFQSPFFDSVVGAALIGSLVLTILMLAAMELTSFLVVWAK